MLKRWLAAVCAALMLLTTAGCRKGNTQLLNFAALKTGDKIVTIETSMGTIQAVLFPQAAPKAVENFTTLASQGYYDNLIFHRVIEGFMVQSGDPTGTGRGGQSIWKKSFANEISPKARNFRGALAMANSGTSTSNGSQFYIVQAGTENIDSALSQGSSMAMTDQARVEYKKMGGAPWLDGGYTVFGQVYEGMDVVDQIASVAVDSSDKPLTPVTITKITVGTYR